MLRGIIARSESRRPKVDNKCQIDESVETLEVMAPRSDFNNSSWCLDVDSRTVIPQAYTLSLFANISRSFDFFRPLHPTPQLSIHTCCQQRSHKANMLYTCFILYKHPRHLARIRTKQGVDVKLLTHQL